MVKILERLEIEMAWLRIYPKLPLRMDFADPETASYTILQSYLHEV